MYLEKFAHKLEYYPPIHLGDNLVFHGDFNHEVPMESIAQYRIAHSAHNEKVGETAVVVRYSAGCRP